MASSSGAEILYELEFKWGKKRGVGGKRKDVQFYDSFTYDGVEYNLYDCVYVHKEGHAPDVGKLVKIWENGDKSRRVKVHWYFRPLEVSYYLKDVEWLENELFLASGSGNGLANLNPLEAIGGKCNVICISKDYRNPLPSAKELEKADYVFYRTFDVGKCTIADQIGDSVGGLEVKFVFNRKESVRTHDLGIIPIVEIGEKNAVVAKRTPILSVENVPQELINVELDKGHHMRRKDCTPMEQVRMRQKSSSGEGTCEVVEKKLTTTLQCTPAVHVKSTPDKVNLGSIDKVITSGNKNVGSKLGGEKDGVQDITSSFNPDQIVDRVKSLKSPLLHCEASSSKVKSSKGSTVLEKSATPPVSRELSSNAKHNCEVVMNSCGLGNDVKLVEKSCALDERLSKASGATANKTSNKETKSLTTNSSLNTTGKSALEGPQTTKTDKSSIGSVTSQLKRFADKEKLKSGGDSGHEIKEKPLDVDSCYTGEGASKKPKLGDSTFISKDKNTITNSKNDGASMKRPESRITSSGFNSKARIDNNPSKEYQNGKKEILSNDALPDVTISKSRGIEKKCEVQTFEATRRPLSGKSNWMKLPWEERMKTAHSQGRLVLFQNLDPKLTSEEVEDIMWHAFEEECTAKMVQHTATSNPHSGEAFAIFKTKEVADKVLKKLDEGCLILPNRRPLVACSGVYVDSEEQKKYFGHLAIDKARMQIQRELKEAVSTSHYSQNNTIEYEMAMAWCWQQARNDKCWEKLHEEQRKQVTGLVSDLKKK